MMKVLHLFQSYLPPSQQWAYNLIKNLPEIENHIAARHYLKHDFYSPGFHFCDAPMDGVIAWDHSTSWLLWKNWLPKMWIKASQKLLNKEMNNVTVYALKHKIDILHAHFGHTAWLFRSVAQKTGLPFVISFYGHDYQYKIQQKPVYKKRYKRLFQEASMVTAEGPHGAMQLEAIGCPPKKIKVIPLGVNTEAIPERDYKKKLNSLSLLQIASYTRKKGHIYTVKAFAEALKICPNMSLTLVGDEREVGIKQEVIKYIKTQQIEDKVSLLDWLDYKELHRFMAQYDVFIHPSCHTEMGDCEGGAPTILLDAMAVGLPIISTQHCDIPFVVGEEEGLAEEKNVEGLTKSISWFYQHSEEQYKQASLEIRKRVKHKFNVSNNAELLNTFYKKML